MTALATYDLPAVERFINELEGKQVECKDFCSDLAAQVACQLIIAQQLHSAIAGWKEAVFRGVCEFDQEVESVFRNQLEKSLPAASAVSRSAVENRKDCCLDSTAATLLYHVRALEGYHKVWIRPELSSRPAYRTTLSPAQMERMQKSFSVMNAEGK